MGVVIGGAVHGSPLKTNIACCFDLRILSASLISICIYSTSVLARHISKCGRQRHARSLTTLDKQSRQVPYNHALSRSFSFSVISATATAACMAGPTATSASALCLIFSSNLFRFFSAFSLFSRICRMRADFCLIFPPYLHAHQSLDGLLDGLLTCRI